MAWLKPLIFVTGTMVPLGILLLGIVHHDRLGTRWRMALGVFAAAVVGGFLALHASLMISNLQEPREFDFKHFWTFGAATADGESPYEHEVLLKHAEPLNPAPEVIRQLYCWYPPTTQLLFVPLGWFSFKTAMLLWYVFHELILFVDIWLLWKWAVPRRDWLTLLSTAGIVLLMRATWETVYYAQTNYLLLLCWLLAWRFRERASGGVWLALAAIVKPIGVIPAIYYVLRGKWKSLASFVVTVAGASLLALAVFGWDLWDDYFGRNPVSHDYSLELTTESVNQSLLATVLRATRPEVGDGSPIFLPLHLMLLAGVIGLTAWSIIALDDERDDWAFGMTLCMAVLIYPATMTHYATYLVIPIVFMSFRTGRWPRIQQLSMLSIAVSYGLIAVQQTFLAVLLLWFVIPLLGFQLQRESADAEKVAT